MRLSTLARIFLLLPLLLTATAFAQEIPTCSSRLPSMERAKCLVDWHKQTMIQFGRASSSSYSRPASSAGSTSFRSVVTGATSSSSPVLSCSRAYGAVRAACLVQQRKDLLKQLAERKYVPPPPPPSAKPRNCARYTDGATRMRCLGGGEIILSSSSAPVSSSSSMSGASSSAGAQ